MGAFGRLSPLFLEEFPLMMSGLGLFGIFGETAPSLTLGLCAGIWAETSFYIQASRSIWSCKLGDGDFALESRS
jgi:hypothetical protein